MVEVIIWSFRHDTSYIPFTGYYTVSYGIIDTTIAYSGGILEPIVDLISCAMNHGTNYGIDSRSSSVLSPLGKIERTLKFYLQGGEYKQLRW